MADTSDAAASLKDDEGTNHEATWWASLRWIADVLFLPCKPAVFPFLACVRHADAGSDNVTGTILCRPRESDRRATLCLQEAGGAAGAPPLLVLNLPIGTGELAKAGRVSLECDRHWSGAGPLLAAPRWAVQSCGRKAGFASPRRATEVEARALEAVRAVSAGVGALPPPLLGGGGSGGGGGWEWLTYLRGSFERVVGSADCESYHLVDPSGSLGLELSFFFFRV